MEVLIRTQKAIEPKTEKRDKQFAFLVQPPHMLHARGRSLLLFAFLRLGRRVRLPIHLNHCEAKDQADLDEHLGPCLTAEPRLNLQKVAERVGAPAEHHLRSDLCGEEEAGVARHPAIKAEFDGEEAVHYLLIEHFGHKDQVDVNDEPHEGARVKHDDKNNITKHS